MCTTEQIFTALEKVLLKDMVLSLPGQLDFHISEDGSNLSMGTRQLIAIARALLRDSKILLLDEATASVDTHTDRRLQEVVQIVCAGRTVITIAHRIETIMQCDKILVLEQGRVVEFDSPQALLKLPESQFAQLAEKISPKQ